MLSLSLEEITPGRPLRHTGLGATSYDAWLKSIAEAKKKKKKAATTTTQAWEQPITVPTLAPPPAAPPPAAAAPAPPPAAVQEPTGPIGTTQAAPPVQAAPPPPGYPSAAAPPGQEDQLPQGRPWWEDVLPAAPTGDRGARAVVNISIPQPGGEAVSVASESDPVAGGAPRGMRLLRPGSPGAIAAAAAAQEGAPKKRNLVLPLVAAGLVGTFLLDRFG